MDWYLSMMFGVIFSTQTTSVTLSPMQMGRMGPMSQEECINSANALNAASPRWRTQCERQIPGGVMIQGFR